MLIERVRRAVAPDYEILEEVAGGGMGLVYSARQHRLDRKVAIKILRPELATAIAAERFKEEGRGLARLAHPNIVQVFDADEKEGLFYCVMEFVEGETLAERLSRGPLSRAEALRLAEDLLGALTFAHAMGVVHRDVKPANIFLRGGRALLGDFGVARWRELSGENPLTTPGQLVGTLRYMGPELHDGLPATARTDVYAAGMVIWEACTGARWPLYQNPKAADWSTIPPALAASVRKALEPEPEQRWENAAAMSAALGRRAPPRRSVLMLTAAVLLGAIGVWAVWKPGGAAEVESGLVVEIGPFSAAPAEESLRDSTASYIRDLLSGFPDFFVPEAGRASRTRPAVRLHGTVARLDASLLLTMEEAGMVPGGAQRIFARDSGPAAEWQQIAEKVAADAAYQIWKRAADDPVFPANAIIPSRESDRFQLARAEQLFSLGRWEDAQKAYGGLDSTCLLCALRSVDIARWFGLIQPSMQLDLLRREEARFPDHYRSLIHAALLPPGTRLDTLAAAARTWPGFFLASFEYADELFHRGPLYGRLRSEALAELRNALLYRPRFEPAWEHLTWLLLTDGDSTTAGRALDSLKRKPPVSDLSGALVNLRDLGFHWRFLAVDSARRFSKGLLADPRIQAFVPSVAGARLLMTMDAPRGAVELGELFTTWRDREDAAEPGLLARLFGYAALGRLDSVRVTQARLARSSSSHALSYALLGLELEAVLRGFDLGWGASDSTDILGALSRSRKQVADNPALRQRATWMLGLLAARSGDTAAVTSARRTLAAEAAPADLGKILEAAGAGRTQPAQGLRLLPVIPELDREPEYPDPLEDAVVHLLRAEWLERLDSLAEARGILRWHEHSQMSKQLYGPPQAGEMAWALGTLVRWKRALLLETVGPGTVESCSTYQAVARLWNGAPPPYGARADSAGFAFQRLHCADPR
jgi:protein kinase-like protein